MLEQLESPTPDAISALAHQFWEEEGRPEGKAEEHWRRAEEQLRQGLQSDEQVPS